MGFIRIPRHSKGILIGIARDFIEIPRHSRHAVFFLLRLLPIFLLCNRRGNAVEIPAAIFAYVLMA